MLTVCPGTVYFNDTCCNGGQFTLPAANMSVCAALCDAHYPSQCLIATLFGGTCFMNIGAVQLIASNPNSVYSYVANSEPRNAYLLLVVLLCENQRRAASPAT